MRVDDVAAVIFDFDGLILDTETPEFESWSAVFHEHGATLDIDVWASFVGRRRERSIRTSIWNQPSDKPSTARPYGSVADTCLFH